MKVSVHEKITIPPKRFSKELFSLLTKTAEKLHIPYRTMASGAGHDAMVFSDVTEAGMIFIPSKDGRSHCTEEYSEIEHLALGTDLLFETVKELTEVEDI